MLLDTLKPKGCSSWYSLASHLRSENKSVATADGKLFLLPLELLEETASYFTHSEAAKVLTVNSLFHNVFSGVVWSYVYLGDLSARLIPKSAWKKYGHLVRTALVGLNEADMLPAISMPNLVELDIYLGDHSHLLFEHVELPHLRQLRLTLEHGKWTRDGIKKGVELAQRLKRNGQPVEVEWDMCVTSEDDMLMLDEMLGLADDTAFDSLSLMIMSTFGPFTVLPHLPKLALLLKRIAFSSAKVLDSIFGGDTSVIFPRLESLQLDGMSLEDYSCGPNTITPQRLPTLKKLQLYTTMDDDQHWISSLLNSDMWSNLTDLVLSGCSDDLDFEAAAACMPNLEHLDISDCSFNLDAATIASLLPHLEYLSFGDSIQFSYDTTQVPQLQHTSLKTLEFQYDWSQNDEQKMPLPLLQFIVNGAPNLESIELHGCGVSMDDLKTLSGQVNPSVRALHIESAEKSFNSDSVAAMIGLFPNLKKCTVIDDEYKARKVLPDQHPNLEFVFHPTH